MVDVLCSVLDGNDTLVSFPVDVEYGSDKTQATVARSVRIACATPCNNAVPMMWGSLVAGFDEVFVFLARAYAVLLSS